MRLVLLGGAPGAGKTTTARELLRLAQDGQELVQWIDVDALWTHQPWRVDDARITMLRANLAAVMANAQSAGVASLIVTWVYQDASMHELVAGLGPDDTDVVTVQLVLEESEWRRRCSADPARPSITEFFEHRYLQAQATPVDHIIDVTYRPPSDAAVQIAGLLGLLHGGR